MSPKTRADKKQKHPSQKEEALCDSTPPYGGTNGRWPKGKAIGQGRGFEVWWGLGS